MSQDEEFKEVTDQEENYEVNPEIPEEFTEKSDPVPEEALMLSEKTLANTNVEEAKENTSDLVIYGDGDSFKLLCKASSKSEGWMKSTKVLHIPNSGCIVQVTTQQKNPDGSYAIAEALTFVPGAYLKKIGSNWVLT